MKKLIVTSFCIAQSFLSFGQYFNKSIEGAPDIIGNYNIEQVSQDTIMLFPAAIHNNKLLLHATTILAANGDTVISKVYLDSTKSIATGWSNSTNRTSDGGFIMGGGLQDTVTYGHLIKFNRLGDTVWTKTYGDTMNFHTFRQAIEIKDKSYVVVGEKKQGGWLLKTDSLGNVIWNRHYTSHGDIERLTSVYPTTDGGYILGGTRRHFVNTNPRNNYDPLIIKVDSMGVEEWAYINDTQFDDAIAYAIQTMDGNYIFSSSISYSQPGSISQSQPTIFKVDTNGNLMWSKSFGYISTNSVFVNVKELPDSSLIAVGRMKDFRTIKGLMVKTDQNGDSIFVQTYEHDPNGIDNQNYLWDVIPMDDGGFMAAGEVLGVPPAVPFRQDAWVIRVDSMGCIISNCLVGEESIEYREESIEVYPNPTSGTVNLRTTEDIQSIEIYNLQGQKVQEVNPKERRWELPEQSGLYLIRIQDREGKVYTEKVIKE